MRKILIVSMTLALMSLASAAQTPPVHFPHPHEAGTPSVEQLGTTDEVVIAWLETAKVASRLAHSDCQKLDSVKQWRAIQRSTQAKIENRLKGQTVDWITFTIIPKVQRPAYDPKAK